MVEGSTFHCAVSAHSLKEEEEGAEHGHRGSKHPQGRLSGAEKPQQSVEKERPPCWDCSHTPSEFLESAAGRWVCRDDGQTAESTC